MDNQLIILCVGFFIIAFIYASVGFGGGSSYLALLALPVFLLPFPVIRSTALFCNILVVSGSCIVFFREGKLQFKEVWPYLATSVPMAYIGGLWPIKQKTFFILLGIILCVAAFLLWFQPEKIKGTPDIKETSLKKGVLGIFIGFLSGLVGIGGGIFLTPIVHFLRWSEPKKIAALASVFILVNSISGLAGQFQRGIPELNAVFITSLLISVFVGGQLGLRIGLRKFDSIYIKRITAILILVAALNILRDQLA